LRKRESQTSQTRKLAMILVFFFLQFMHEDVLEDETP